MQCVRQLRGALGGQVHLLGATAVCATTVEAGLHGGAGNVQQYSYMHMHSDLWTLTLKTLASPT